MALFKLPDMSMYMADMGAARQKSGGVSKS